MGHNCNSKHSKQTLLKTINVQNVWLNVIRASFRVRLCSAGSKDIS